jgi:type I restriction enzyme S subunit
MSFDQTVRLGDVADINPGLSQTPSSDTPVSLVPMSAVDALTGTTESQERLFGQVSKGLTPFRDGDLLIAKITPCFENGKIAQAQLQHELGFGSTEFHVIRAHPDVAEPRYLLRFLRQERVRRAGEARMTGSGGQRRVPQKFISELALPLPSLAEQRRIAGTLDLVDALRAKRRFAFAQLDTLTQSIFFEMFGDPIRNPMRFPVRAMSDLVDRERPITYGILKPGPDQEEGVRYVRVVDMKDGGIDSSSVRMTSREISASYARSLLREGDLLMSIRGHVGRAAIVPASLDGANITQDTARLAIREVSPLFVRECLRTAALRHWMERHTKGVAVRGINLGDVKKMPIIAPSAGDQRRFEQRVEAIERRAQANRVSLARFDALFASLQDRAFRGEL